MSVASSFKSFLAGLPALPLLLGVVGAAVAVGVSAWWLLPIVALALPVIVYEGRTGYVLFSLGAVATLVSAWLQAPADLPSDFFDGREYTFVGCVDEAVATPTSQRVVVTLDAQGRQPRCLLVIPDLDPELAPGDSVRFTAAAEPPYLSAGVPGTISSTFFNRRERVVAVFSLNSADILIGTSSGSLKARLWQWRRRLADDIYSSGLQPETSSLLVSAWLGEGRAPEARESFRTVGLSHLLCVSGFHMAVIAWVLSLFLYPLRAWSHVGRIRYAIVVAMVWGFALLVGATPSVLRASAMITVFYLCRLLQRTVLPFNSLALSVAVIVLASPYSIFSLGLQLSVSAVLGLLVFSHPLNRVSPRRRGLYRLAEFVAVPVAALLGTMPVLLLWFHTLPLASVPVNAIACVIFPVFMVVGALYVALFYLGFNIGFLADICSALERAMMNLCDFGADRLPPLEQVWLTPAAMTALVVGLILLAVALHTSHKVLRWTALGGIPVAVMVMVVARPEPVHQVVAWGNRRVTNVCVADGTRAYVASSGGRCDAYVLGQYLSRCGIDADSVEYVQRPERLITLGSIPMTFVGSRDTTVEGRPEYVVPHPRYRCDVATLCRQAPQAVCIVGVATPLPSHAPANMWPLKRGAMVRELTP